MPFLRIALLYLLCTLAACTPVAPPDAVNVLQQARVELTIHAETSHVNVQLPYGWDYHHAGTSGFARFALEFDAPTATDEPWALYFDRLGNAYQIKLNGVVLDQNGTVVEADAHPEYNPGPGNANLGDYAKIPRLVRIPSGVLRPHNQLEVSIHSESGRRSGMPVVWVGPKKDLDHTYQQEFALRVGGYGVLTVFSLLVGAYALVLWISQTDPRPKRRGMRDRLYLFAATAEFSWAFYIADNLIERPPLPWQWWYVAINMALGLWMGSLLMFCHTMAGWEQHPASRVARSFVLLLLLLGPYVAFTAAMQPNPLLMTLWQASFSLVFVPSTMLFVVKAMRTGNAMQRVIALAFVVNLPVGLHDFYVLRLGDPFGSHIYLRFSATLFGLALGAIAIERFRHANVRVRNMLDTLSQRVADKERELSSSYQRMEQIAREQERVQERARILRDMHDGVGAHISSAIRQLQSTPPNHDEILLTLRDSLDQLKLSIDALNLPPGDITALLANLRYRLEPRFRSTGLALEWAVLSLPDLPQLDATAMRHLQYIFFEALSNVMQHAHASVLRMEASLQQDSAAASGHSVRIRICDNGQGFDTSQPPRKGLASMAERAHAIGATIAIDSRAGATTVTLSLPASPLSSLHDYISSGAQA